MIQYMKRDQERLYKRNYFLHKNDALSNRVASDLEKIIETIVGNIPDCVIILGGSLAYGEGKYLISDNDFVILSDYDIFVIVPSLYNTLRSLTSKPLKNLLSDLHLSNSLELVFVWEGALRLKLTTIAGDVLVRREMGEKLLNHLSIPEPVNNLKRAFKYLLQGISAIGSNGRFLRKSIIQAFQALLLLLAKREAVGYDVWKNFYSLKHALHAAEQYRGHLDAGTYTLLKNILAEELADNHPRAELGFEEFCIIRNFISKLYLESRPSFRENDYLRYLTFNLRDGRLPNPLFNSTRHYFNAAYLLSMSVEGIKSYDERKLRKAEAIVAKLTGHTWKSEPPQLKFEHLVERLCRYDESYLHKVKLTA